MVPTTDQTTTTTPSRAAALEARRQAARAELALVLEEKAKRAAERSLATFIREAWAVLEPSRQLVWNWHIDALCLHLEAVSRGALGDLLINEPPGTMKSSIVSVFWPAWEWIARPELRYLCASHDQTLSTRDNIRVRDLVSSEWYQRRWPHVQLRLDQNQKTRFDTTAGGWRIGTSIGGRAIGEHPHRKIYDDLHKPTEVPSAAERDFVWHWHTQTMSTRGVALRAVTVAIGQRLHEDDFSGRMLAQGGATHICLPMRWEPDRMPPTPLGWTDPRRTPGELLWPEMLPEDVVAKAELTLGSWGTAAQLQQRPAPIGGLLFKREWFGTVTAMPPDVMRVVRFWDAAATEGGTGPRTAGVKMAITASRLAVVLDVVKGRWSAAGVDNVIAQTAALDGPEVAIREEQEPGSSGKAVIGARALRLLGYNYAGIPATGDKALRAHPLRAAAEAGRVKLLADGSGAWAKEFLDELELFPAGSLKDQVDAASAAFTYLALGTVAPLEIVTGAEPAAALNDEELAAREAALRVAAELAVTEAIAKDGVFWPTGGRR